MRVVLFSEDQQLCQLCRNILSDYRITNEPLIVAAPELPLPEAEIYVWDYRAEMSLARELAARQPHRHLLLVDRKELTGAERSSLAGMMVVLKPATKATLAAWLTQATPEHRLPVGTSRNSRDAVVEALFEANLRLQEYDRDRTTFLARAIHDFRAPLTATNGYCGLLLAGQLGPLSETQREVLSRTQNSVKRLARMTSAMFHLTAGLQVRDGPNLEQGDIRECIKQALHEMQPLADERSIQVITNLKPPSPLRFDHGHIVQVLTNLLENACKFTPKGGTIEIRGYPFFWERRSPVVREYADPGRRVQTSDVTNSFRIDVCNTGPAIAPERLNWVFEEYASYQPGPGSPTAGLGLAICKQIVQQHGGRIWAENEGAGPVLSFVLPSEIESVGGVTRGAEIGRAHTEDKGEKR